MNITATLNSADILEAVEDYIRKVDPSYGVRSIDVRFTDPLADKMTPVIDVRLEKITPPPSFAELAARTLQER